LYQPIFKRKIVFSQSDEPVLLQVGYFIMSSPELLLNIDLKIEDNN